MITKKHCQRISMAALIAAVMLLCMAAGSARAQVKTQPGPVQNDRARQQELKKKRKAQEAARRLREMHLRQKEEAVRNQLQAQNVRARRVAVPRISRLQRVQGGIFVPVPKGAGDTLDDSQQSSTGLTSDRVRTIQGDLLIGKVIGIKDGKLRFTAPHYEGEILVLAGSLARVRFAGKGQQSGPMKVTLVNKDYIRGTVVAITPESVVIETQMAGTITVSRKVVASIAFAPTQWTLLASNFDSGSMEPWKPRTGNWAVRGEKVLVSSRGNRNQALYAQLDQSEALTFVVKVKVIDGHQLYCYLVTFADSLDGYYGRNSVFAQFRSNNCQIGYAQNGGSNHVSSGNVGRDVREGILRFAYDPATGQATTWVDEKKVDQHTIGPKPTKGKYVIFISRYPAQISYLRVLRGIVPPSEGVGTAGKAESQIHSIQFSNKDLVSATNVLLTNGTFLAQTEHGEMRCPVEKLTSIVFATKGQEKPRRSKDDVLVETSSSRLTLQFDKLDDEYLLGSSDHLGQVKLLHSAVRDIRFNIYK